MGIPPNGESHPDEVVTLGDGQQITIRAIRRNDAPRLQALMARLSPESILLRAMMPMKTLTDSAARHLASVDYARSMALVATREPQGSDDVVGVARYATDAANQDEAEVAVVVEDAYQKRGLGSLLLRRLGEYALEHGVRSFVATIAPRNDRVLRLIAATGLAAEWHGMGPGELYIKIHLYRSVQ